MADEIKNSSFETTAPKTVEDHKTAKADAAARDLEEQRPAENKRGSKKKKRTKSTRTKKTKLEKINQSDQNQVRSKTSRLIPIAAVLVALPLILGLLFTLLIKPGSFNATLSEWVTSPVFWLVFTLPALWLWRQSLTNRLEVSGSIKTNHSSSLEELSNQMQALDHFVRHEQKPETEELTRLRENIESLKEFLQRLEGLVKRQEDKLKDITEALGESRQYLEGVQSDYRLTPNPPQSDQSGYEPYIDSKLSQQEQRVSRPQPTSPARDSFDSEIAEQPQPDKSWTEIAGQLQTDIQSFFEFKLPDSKQIKTWKRKDDQKAFILNVLGSVSPVHKFVVNAEQEKVLRDSLRKFVENIVGIPVQLITPVQGQEADTSLMLETNEAGTVGTRGGTVRRVISYGAIWGEEKVNARVEL